MAEGGQAGRMSEARAAITPTRFRVRGTQADAVRFEFELDADDAWHAIARAARLVERPSQVTSLSVMPMGKAR